MRRLAVYLLTFLKIWLWNQVGMLDTSLSSSPTLAMVNGWKIPDNSGHPNYLFCVPSLVILWGFMILPIIFPHCHYSLYYYMGLVTTMKKMHCTTSNHVKCTTIFAFPMSYSQNWTKSHLRFLKFHRFKNHIVWGKF